MMFKNINLLTKTSENSKISFIKNNDYSVLNTFIFTVILKTSRPMIVKQQQHTVRYPINCIYPTNLA